MLPLHSIGGITDFRGRGAPKHRRPVRGHCGTSGCALGECPVLWKSWQYFEDTYPGLRRNKTTDVLGSAATWFDISRDHATVLFIPHGTNGYQLRAPGIQQLPNNATGGEVACNIRHYVAAMQESNRPVTASNSL